MHEGLDDLQTLGELLRLQLGRRFRDLDLQTLGDGREIHVAQDLANRLGADQRGERVLAIFVLCAEIILLV